MKKRVSQFFFSPLTIVVLSAMIYSLIFTGYSLQRLNMLWASYFDLGIMHQTVFNTFKALQNLDASRVLLLTDPHGSGQQIYRMAIHADYFLALLAPLYFLYPGPETLLVFQTLALASGAIGLHFIVKSVLGDSLSKSHLKLVSVVLPVLYLANFAVQRTNYYEFHAVTIATPLIIWMFYFYRSSKYLLATMFGILALVTKEQVGFGLGVFLFVECIRETNVLSVILKQKSFVSLMPNIRETSQKARVLFLLGILSMAYVFATVFFVMPAFRGGDEHFALSYFTAEQSTGSGNVAVAFIQRFFSTSTLGYVGFLLLPLLGAPLLSLYILPALPDLLINLLSESGNMRNFYYHYTALITPWIFISSIDTIGRLGKHKYLQLKYILIGMTFFTLYFSYLESPLPYSARGGDINVVKKADELMDIYMWQQVLASDNVSVSSTGQFAPYLAGRKYFYDFGPNYSKADYVLIRRNEIDDYSNKSVLVPEYAKLTSDKRYIQIYKRGKVEVYKKQI